MSWFGWQSIEVRLDQHPRASGGRPPGSNPPWRDWVYRLSSEVSFFRGMPMGPEAFFEPLGASVLQPYTRSHLKKGFVSHSSSWWDGRQIPLVWVGCLGFMAFQSFYNAVPCDTQDILFGGSLALLHRIQSAYYNTHKQGGSDGRMQIWLVTIKTN